MSLTDLRMDLSTAVAASGVQVLPYVPAGAAPPVVWLRADDPYVSESDTFGAYVCHLEAVLLVNPVGSNLTITTELDNLIEDTLGSIPNAWAIDQVSAPFITVVNESQYLACRIAVSHQLEII